MIRTTIATAYMLQPDEYSALLQHMPVFIQVGKVANGYKIQNKFHLTVIISCAPCTLTVLPVLTTITVELKFVAIEIAGFINTVIIKMRYFPFALHRIGI
jgi:hypothetical protein